MQFIIILFFTGCADPAPPDHIPPLSEEKKWSSPIIDTINSRILNDSIEYYVYLPENFNETKKWPVVYILHSAGGEASNWQEYWKIQQAINEVGFIAIAPNDADGLRWWLNSPRLKNSQYRTFLVEEFKPFVDKSYPTLSKTTFTGIMGFSMGGFGTIHNLSLHPDVFGYGYAINACIKPRKYFEDFGLSNVIGPPNEVDHWNFVSPLLHPERFKNLDNRLFIQTSSEDWFLEENREFHSMLDSLNVTHGYLETEGGHFSPSPQRMKKIAHWFDSLFTHAAKQ